jgi:hypothetical protein
VLLGEGHVGEDVLLGLVQERGELGQLGPDLVGDLAPPGAGGVGMILGERGGDEGRDDTPTALAGMGERIAHAERLDQRVNRARRDTLHRLPGSPP